VLQIGSLQRQIVINMLAIGDRLNKLRAEIGSHKFHQFMDDVLPLLGISRSTGYRWLGFAERLAPLFPNPLVRHHLMTLTDGKGIITRTRADDRHHGPGDVVLTAAATVALKNMPPPPKTERDSAKCEAWVRSFIKAVWKARSLARSGTSGRDQNVIKERVAIIKRFKRFAGRFGLQTAEDLCGFLDKILTELAEEQVDEGNSVRMPTANTMALSPIGIQPSA
jgi:hypothetical protein